MIFINELIKDKYNFTKDNIIIKMDIAKTDLEKRI